MTEADAGQINMKDAGISMPHIYAMLANQAGGYENVNYTLRDMYNEIARRRCHVLGDARAALRYLKNQKDEDPCLYYKHIVDAKGMPARMKVVQDEAFESFVLYTISKYRSLNTSWEVSIDNEMTNFNCSCLRIESFRIPYWCRQLSYIASRRKERFHLIRDTVISLIEDFKIEDGQEKQVGAEVDGSNDIFSKNPQNCRSKCCPGENVKQKPQ
ncbi:hypothetical protein Ahy_B08g089529 [Arachis hypogaea]|uniref:Protein FAR1-RELATED SEQUENCE n=1 Tax=Arachis hypogaea TaxID=3818 RepID=A0A444XY62_ARAHY|nr:hypothetical protein Ahy_B08g089529 [Arachis hypogaea]